MAFYENVFIARQDITQAQVDALADQFTQILKDRGGDVTKREYWGLRTMAYRIKKNRKGHYVLLNISAPADAVQEMERNMRLNEDVLRHLTIRVETLEEAPSAMMQRRDERGVRARHRAGDLRRFAGIAAERTADRVDDQAFRLLNDGRRQRIVCQLRRVRSELFDNGGHAGNFQETYGKRNPAHFTEIGRRQLTLHAPRCETSARCRDHRKNSRIRAAAG